MKKLRLIAIALALFLAVVAAGAAVAPTFAQKVLTREAICVERTYGEGAVVPGDEFSNLGECNSYISSYIQHYNDNATVAETDPATNTTCGGQGQYACANNRCDPGYKGTDFGTCVAQGVTSDQLVIFRECQEAGGSYAFCENQVFGGSEYLVEGGAWVQDCVDAGGTAAGCQNFCVNYIDNDCNTVSPTLAAGCARFIDNGGRPGTAQWSSLGCTGFEWTNDAPTVNVNAEWFRESLTECKNAVADGLSQAERQATIAQCFESSSGNIPFVAEEPISQVPPVAVAYVPISGSNNLGASLLQRKFEECKAEIGNAAGITADDCVALISANSITGLSGAQVAGCLLQRYTNDAQKESCKDLNPPLSTFITVRSGTSTQPPRNVAIADCAKAGVSQVDCQNILNANPDRQLSGVELASCIRGRRTNDGLCDGMKGLDTVPAVVSCAELGACVNGRTCVKNQATGGLSNIGASCGADANLARVIAERNLSPVCNPTTNNFPANAEDGGICCGGGKSECASGICNAAVGEVGLCGGTATTTGGGASGSGGGAGGEINTGLSDEVRGDCSKVNGIVQNVEGSGFVVKCDYDGNGTFGYHQPTQFIYGNEAAAACRALCLNPDADIEEAARERYRELQVEAASANASSSNATRSGALPPGVATTTPVACEVGTFASSFACVSWNRGPCIVESNGCYRKATANEKTSLCPAVHQQSPYRCSEVWGEGCKIHPETGCYARDTIVAEATVEFADAIHDGQAEIQTQQFNVAQQAWNATVGTVSGWADAFNSFWGQIAGGVQGNNGQPAE